MDYQAIEGTKLLYVANSENDIIMDINSQFHYVLLAGRWYYSKSLKDGDWKFQEPKNLPEDFKNIPEDSPMASVRASIPGTSEAQTALLEQSIPQTATIDRNNATVSVTYDGEPKFEKIEDTEVSYAINTDKTVLQIGVYYYCVDDAVWFLSDNPKGPWIVSDRRPKEVDDIPPDSPVYNVKYTYIYETTEDAVYVGYTPGYTNSYAYDGVVVYGTGYYYQPWYGAYYYPRPVTWGFGVHYNPWTGWGFSVGFSNGWIRWGIHPHRRGLWGPRGYHHGYRHGYNRGYRHGRNQGFKRGYAAGSRNSNRNVYNHRSNGVRQTNNARNSQANNHVNNKARSSGKSNNMYSDRNGNVYQRNQNGSYQNRSNNNSQSTQQRQSMDRSYQNRNQGTQNYNRSQQMQRGGGGGRGGGGRGGGGRR